MSHFGNIEMAQHFFRSLSGIEFEPLGNRHDRRALVIAKGSIGANLKTDETQIHVGKNRLDGLLKTGFNPFGQYHGRNILSLAHREVAEGSRALSGGRSGLLLEERFHGISITGLLQGLSEIIVMEDFCNVGQRVEMFLKLPLRDQEEHHQVDRFVVQGIKVDPCLRTAKGPNHIINQIGRSMGNAHPETNSRAHAGFTLLDDIGNGFTISWANLVA